MKEIIYLFPEPIRSIIDTHIASNWHMLQEIRIRIHQPIEFVYDHKSEWLERVVITKTEITHIINQISEFSLYRLEDELREGYITIEGGHRVGLAGKVNTESGTVKALQHITFLNIRIAKQTIGAASEIIPYLFENGYSHTLIVGPPQTGKRQSYVIYLGSLVPDGVEEMLVKWELLTNVQKLAHLLKEYLSMILGDERIFWMLVQKQTE